jgi:hypothetical protein
MQAGESLQSRSVGAQVSELLERMTPASCRIDLQTDSFEDLLKQQGLAAQPGAVSGTEPWYAPADVHSLKYWQDSVVGIASCMLNAAPVHEFMMQGQCSQKHGLGVDQPSAVIQVSVRMQV